MRVFYRVFYDKCAQVPYIPIQVCVLLDVVMDESWTWSSRHAKLHDPPPQQPAYRNTAGLSFFSLQRTPIGLKRRKEEGKKMGWLPSIRVLMHTLILHWSCKTPPPPNHHHLNPYMWLCTYSLFRWDGLSQVDCSHNVTCIVKVQHNTWKTLLSHGWRVSAAWNPVIELRDICAPLQSQSVHYCQPKVVQLKHVNQVNDLM